MVVVFFIVLIVGFIDDNSFMHRFDRRRMSQLSNEIEAYKAQYEEADRCLREMDENPKAIEKMARERYFMKRPGEDIFVIRDAEDNDNTESTVAGPIKE